MERPRMRTWVSCDWNLEGMRRFFILFNFNFLVFLFVCILVWDAR